MASREIKQLDNLMDGAVTERFNAELSKLWENIFDMRTAPDKVRVINLQFKFTPSKSRDSAKMTYTVTTKLAAPEAIEQTVLMYQRDDGTIQVSEHTDQIPGQIGMDGSETKFPKVVSFTPASEM